MQYCYSYRMCKAAKLPTFVTIQCLHHPGSNYREDQARPGLRISVTVTTTGSVDTKLHRFVVVSDHPKC